MRVHTGPRPPSLLFPLEWRTQQREEGQTSISQMLHSATASPCSTSLYLPSARMEETLGVLLVQTLQGRQWERELKLLLPVQ